MEYPLNKILEELRRARGIDFSNYRTAILTKRLSARMTRLSIKDPFKYLERLWADPSECDCLIDAIAIKVSSFFRDPIVFETIAQRVLPRIIEINRHSKMSQIRVWSAGAASGEEAYSIAILIHELLANEAIQWHPYIFATDISRESLKKAEAGRYPRESLKNTKVGILDKYFTVKDNVYEIRPVIRKMVRFSHDDLTSKDRIAPADSVFGAFDLILCRNVIIYFSSELQKRVLHKLYNALARGGFLILGNSESLDPETERRLIFTDSRNCIFQKPA
ncbi:CheR family methyltransferase [Desulfonema magnum]|uniref:protein-glutamate O-methyltransferase n=1 Tax=Desulfonema magnum TaxID=45655 RepID=A0A975BL08_9BACT|nr:protein-glutamate O-methyltransferase CheR [Desulfonema magnum]QTA87227.1 SAM-dependent methyltransferase domain-containing protein, CheR-type [Desulfonema magnum]